MKAGIPVGIEVGDVYGLEECWELVRTYEETETPFMFMENCCYRRRELVALNMIKEKQPGASHSMDNTIKRYAAAKASDNIIKTCTFRRARNIFRMTR